MTKNVKKEVDIQRKIRNVVILDKFQKKWIIMDPRSHEIFAQTLLEAADEKNTSPEIWGNAPDVDIKFLHRWYRHRISVLPHIYEENLKGCKQENVDKDAIVLCIMSHLYLDIFNGIVFPFGAWYPIYPEDTVLYDVLDNVDDPKLFVQDLMMLSGKSTFNDMFYAESKGIMQEFVHNIKVESVKLITDIIVRRIAMHAGMSYDNICKKAMKDIAKFTDDDTYNDIREIQTIDACEQFEISYAFLIEKAMNC